MITPNPELVVPLLAVNGWKHQELVKCQAIVLQVALAREYFSPSDIPEDSTSPENRAGVASNAWNGLRALEIIERVPMSLTIESRGIFGGRTRNKNPGAKGRWTACYTLRSRALATAWLARHGYSVARAEVATQIEMAIV